MDLILKNAKCLVPKSESPFLLESQVLDIGIEMGKISEISNFISSHRASRVVDLKGLHMLPGIIDTQVHFRDPGLTHKEDFSTGSQSAVMGGVTTVFDMPNTKPATTSTESYLSKWHQIKTRSYCDFGLYLGASDKNFSDAAQSHLLPSCVGVKIFMGSSTGTLLVDEDNFIRRHFEVSRGPFAIHAEDEALLLQNKKNLGPSPSVAEHPNWRSAESSLRATKRITQIAQDFQKPTHILHVSTMEEVAFFMKKKPPQITLEVLPQHLLFSAPECYERLGTLAQQNPPLRNKTHREALWAGLSSGLFDVIGSDHAPHLLSEKAQHYPLSPSGMPGVQTLVPILLNFVNEGRISLEHFTQMVTENPRRIFGIQRKGRIQAGYDADFTIVDMKQTRNISNSQVQSKCGWTPFDGIEVKGWVKMTMLRGEFVMIEDEVTTGPRGAGIEIRK